MTVGLVEFVDDGVFRPGQPIGPRIQTRGQDHGLPHTGRGGREELVVEELGAHSHSVDHRLHSFG
jgi:hypothetical protein